MEKITFKQFKTLLTSQPFFIWNNLSKNNEEEFDFDNFWKQDLEYADTSAAQVIMSTFSKISDKAQEDLISKGAKILTGSIEERIEKTKEAFNSNEILLNPVFEYKGAIAKPFAFDFKNNIPFEIKYSKKTKRMDFMKIYYQSEIIKNNNLIISDYYFIIPVNAPGKKGVIDLTKVNRVSLSKTGSAHDETNKKNELKSVGIMESLKSPGKIILKDIDLYIKAIEEARDINEPVNEFHKDSTEFGNNQNWDELLEFFQNKWAGYNGNVVSKKIIANNEEPSGDVIEKLESINESIIIDHKMIDGIISDIKKSQKIIWYDFEGFSLPFPAIDNTKPYQQMVFQLSKIITNKDIDTISSYNIVWDPKNLSLDDLFGILESVYSDQADKYVVYNKGYENTRLKEIIRLLHGDNRLEKAKMMFAHIEANTIDLMDLFQINSKNKLPAILMHDQKAKASIKNIEKHISENKYDIGYKIKEYKNLDVKNGGMAMQIAIERATGVMGDQEWNNKVIQLKEYCENDVKAMIMVYHFVLYLKNKK